MGANTNRALTYNIQTEYWVLISFKLPPITAKLVRDDNLEIRKTGLKHSSKFVANSLT